MTVAAPLIHLNGSGKENLIMGWRAAHEDISEALESVCKAAPHMRDYYPLKDGDEVYRRAREDHQKFVRQLSEMLAHYEQLTYAIMERK